MIEFLERGVELSCELLQFYSVYMHQSGLVFNTTLLDIQQLYNYNIDREDSVSIKANMTDLGDQSDLLMYPGR